MKQSKIEMGGPYKFFSQSFIIIIMTRRTIIRKNAVKYTGRRRFSDIKDAFINPFRTPLSPQNTYFENLFR